MEVSQELISEIVKNVLAASPAGSIGQPDLNAVPVGVSNRHIHLTQEDV